MKEYKLKINGNNYDVAIDEVEETTAKVEVNGTPFQVEFKKPITKSRPKVVINRPTETPGAAPAVQVSKPVANTGNGTVVTSPLPGVVLNINVKEGDAVKKGQTILILEAMKMENSIEAPADGTVSIILVQKGDSVLEGAQLAVIA